MGKKNSYNHRVKKDGVVYDSGFEYRLLTQTRVGDYEYHPPHITYTVNRTRKYHPDWLIEKDGMRYYMEAKGRFNFRADLQKYQDIKADLTEAEELIFIFENPKTPIPGSKPRKDGTRLNNGEWATKEGFRHTTLGEIDAFIGTL